jgi:hypothetical protein
MKYMLPKPRPMHFGLLRVGDYFKERLDLDDECRKVTAFQATPNRGVENDRKFHVADDKLVYWTGSDHPVVTMFVENDGTDNNRILRFHNVAPDVPIFDVQIKYTEGQHFDGVHIPVVLDRTIIPAIIEAINARRNA